MKYAALLLSLVLTGCASAPRFENGANWIMRFNEAGSGEVLEQAAEMMERNDYIRHSKQAVQATVTRSAGSLPPTQLEKEYVYFKIASFYLYQRERQASPSNIAKTQQYMRKLLELSDLHLMSRYVIARIQELDGYPQSYAHILNVPRNTGYWKFNGCLSGECITLNDFRDEYDETISERHHGFFGKVYHTFALLTVALAGSTVTDDQISIEDLKHPITLQVLDKAGATVALQQPNGRGVYESR